MLRGTKILVLLLIVGLSGSPIMAADPVIIQYVTSGPNGGFSYDSLKVYQSGTVDLITRTYNSTTTKTDLLTQVELNDLVNLFVDNNYSSLDSMYMSGCLACPVYSITFRSKTVIGNTNGGSTQLATIKAGLDTLANKVRLSMRVEYLEPSHAISNGNLPSSFHSRLRLNNEKGRLGLEIFREGNSGAFTVLGRSTMRAH